MTNREIGLMWKADVLSRLYEAWPGTISLEMDDTIEATKVAPEGRRERILLWIDLWKRLKEDGLVNMKPSPRSSTLINFAGLTEKGDQYLSATLPDTTDTVGKKLGDIVKTVGKEIVVQGAKTGATEIIKASGVAEILGAFVGGAIKSLSNL